MGRHPWLHRVSTLFVCDPLLRNYFAAIALVSSGVLFEHLVFRLAAELRIVVFAGSIALFCIYVKANQASPVIKGVALLCTLLAALFSPDPTLLGIIWIFLILGLQPDGQPYGSALVRLSSVVLIVYLFVVRSGVLMGWDDQVGRELLRSVGKLFGQGTDRVTVLGLFGPWLLLWVALVSMSAVVAKSQNLLARAVRTLVLLVAPVGLATFAMSPLPLVVAVGILAGVRPEAEVPARVKPSWVGLSIGGILCLVAAWATYQQARIVPLKNVAIAKVELGTFNSERGVPTTDKIKYEANFGRLLRFLRSQGVEVAELPEKWTGEDLRKYQTVLFVNRRTKATDRQVDELYAAINDGLRVVVAADHTDIMGVRDPSNHLLSRAPMRVRFDSAMPFFANREWHKALWLNPAVRAIAQNAGDLSISVGASLNIWGNAEPLVVGHAGYADPGDPKNPPGFLSDMTYGRGEPVFDIPLVAQAGYGKGSIVCFGDTSSFQDSALIGSGPFVLNLLSPRVAAAWHPWLIGAMLILGVALVLASDLRASRTPWISGLFLAGLVGVLYQGYAGQRPVQQLRNAMVLDSELGPKYPGFFTDQKIDKLADLCDRQSLELIAAPVSKAVRQNPKGLLIVAPTLVPSSGTVQAVERYVQEGGRLFLVCGGDTAYVGNRLLAPFGMSIKNSPLGGADATEIVDKTIEKKVAFTTPPVQMDVYGLLLDAYEITGGDQVIAKTLGKPTVVTKAVGKGEVLVVSDSRFVTTKSLGQELKLNLPPARFLYALLERISK